MRKKIAVCIMLILALGVTGCGNSLVKKSIEQAKTSIEIKDYDKALLSLEIALDEDSDNEEAKKLYGIVDKYQKSKKLLEENNVDEAKKSLDEINSEYVNYTIKEDVDSLRHQIEDKIKEIELINSDLTKLVGLIDEKRYDEAIILFEEINKSSLNEEQKTKANELKTRIDTELAEIEAQKKAEEEARLAEEARRLEEERAKLEESNKLITADKAIELVKNYLINKGQYVPGKFMIGSETNDEYSIRAYDDMGDHEATSGWYIVNKKTGNIQSMF